MNNDFQEQIDSLQAELAAILGTQNAGVVSAALVNLLGHALEVIYRGAPKGFEAIAESVRTLPDRVVENLKKNSH